MYARVELKNKTKEGWKNSEYGYFYSIAYNCNDEKAVQKAIKEAKEFCKEYNIIYK